MKVNKRNHIGECLTSESFKNYLYILNLILKWKGTKCSEAIMGMI